MDNNKLLIGDKEFTIYGELESGVFSTKEGCILIVARKINSTYHYLKIGTYKYYSDIEIKKFNEGDNICFCFLGINDLKKRKETLKEILKIINENSLIIKEENIICEN